jgi:hypothetical protein
VTSQGNKRRRRRRTLWFGAGAVRTLLCGNAALACWETAPPTGEHLIELDSGDLNVIRAAPRAPRSWCSSMAWLARRHDATRPPYRQDLHVVRVELLGHGGSAKPRTGYGIPEQAGHVIAVFGALGVDTATIVGHSPGGSVATALAEQKPELLEAVGHTSMLEDPQRTGGLLREFAHRRSNRRSTR